MHGLRVQRKANRSLHFFSDKCVPVQQCSLDRTPTLTQSKIIRVLVFFSLTFNCVILDVFISHGGSHGQGITSDTGGDVRYTERQSTPVFLVNESRHFAAFKMLGS